MIIPALLFPLFFFTAFAGGLSRVDSVPGFDYAAGYTAFVYGFVLLQASAFGGDLHRLLDRARLRVRLLAPADARRAAARRDHRRLLARRAAARGVHRARDHRRRADRGLTIDGSAVDLVGLYTLALLVNAAAMLFGSGVAMRLRTMQAAPAMQMPVFLILFLAPVWVPYDLLTGWVQAAASVNPVTLVLEADRGLLEGDPRVLPAFGAALLLAALTRALGAGRVAQRRARRRRLRPWPKRFTKCGGRRLRRRERGCARGRAGLSQGAPRARRDRVRRERDRAPARVSRPGATSTTSRRSCTSSTAAGSR